MSNQFGDTRIDDDLTLLSETLEEVLRSSGDPADQKYVELKARAEKALDDVKKRVSQASDSYYYRAKQAVYRADGSEWTGYFIRGNCCMRRKPGN